MDRLRRLTTVLIIIMLVGGSLCAQEYLVLDRYGTKRIMIPLGSRVIFKLKGDDRRHSNYLVQLIDSVVVMGNHDIYLRLEDFDTFYFPRKKWRALRHGMMVPAAGFLISAAVHPLVDKPFYDQSEALYTGLALLGLSQSFRLWEWKKFRIKKNSRIWVGGWR